MEEEAEAAADMEMEEVAAATAAEGGPEREERGRLGGQEEREEAGEDWETYQWKRRCQEDCGEQRRGGSSQ